MGTMPPRLKKVPGLQFFKVLGSGKGGVFSLTPDFYLYGLMAVWDSELAADVFFSESEVMTDYRLHTSENWTIKLEPIKSYGWWDGVNPFIPVPLPTPVAGPIAVLTRASIHLKALPAFWKYGKITSHALEAAPGLLASIGMGELPFVRQATFSLWESQEHMLQYAYKGAQHQEVMRKTRADNWYREELFARFQVISATGTWKGNNPLKHIIP